ncbi:MAG: serine/threonine-protein kinase [Planctomycetota bacterium]
MTTRPQPGLVLADTKLETEANLYLQRRLIVFYGVTVGLAGFLYVVGTFLMVLVEGWSRRVLLEPSRLVHAAATLSAVVVLLRLRRCTFRAGTLVFLDALGLYIAIGASVSIYALEYGEGPVTLPAILALFIVARAVVVPCSAATTFLLSLPAPLCMLVVQLAHGTLYVMDGVEIWPEDFFEAVVWNLVVLFLAVCVAAVASRINFGLRHQVREAQRLGQYRLEERIGEGAMGEVYRGKHAMLRRPTAIKLIHPDATDPDMLQRFEREVRETSRLSHPNTIRVFDYGRTPEGVFYYAMEYLDGANLREIVERSGPMPPARVIHALTQVCGALQEAHDTGLVHRDIKPGNIILCQRGGVYDVIKVVDFGLVKDLGAASPALTQVGQICGTPETMAPEVLGGAEATPASDLYAVGVVAYYLLTGTPVFDASSATEFIGHHLHTPPLPLHERIPSVPPDLAAAVHRCLAKDPADRFASARQLKVALERCTDADGWTENDAAAWWQALEAA